MAARGLGLLWSRRGEFESADRWFTEAAVRSTRLPDRYQWVHAHVLDTVIQTALDRRDHERATPIIDSLHRLAARCDMRELVARAYVHRHRIGDHRALVAARCIAEDIDNPALHDLVGAAG
jgi:uncharacterized protein HemY